VARASAHLRAPDIDEEFSAVIGTSILRSELSDCEARLQSEFVERLLDDGCQRDTGTSPDGSSVTLDPVP
jgi:hypothetical protein